MPKEHVIRWYDERPEGIGAEFEFSADGNNWTPIEPYGRTYHRDCYEANVMADDGYVRMPGIPAKPGLSADGHDIHVLPEPMTGITVGIMLLCEFWRRKNAHRP